MTIISSQVLVMAAARQARQAAGISRIQAKLANNLETGNYYEAHQLYRTLYFRYVIILLILGHTVSSPVQNSMTD